MGNNIFSGFLMIAFSCALIFLGVIWVGDRIALRGVHIVSQACEGFEGNFVATVRVKNTDTFAKGISVNVQDHLVPLKGQQWPDRRTRIRFERETKRFGLTLGPGEEQEGHVTYQVPGLSAATCTVRAKVGQQERLEAP